MSIASDKCNQIMYVCMCVCLCDAMAGDLLKQSVHHGGLFVFRLDRRAMGLRLYAQTGVQVSPKIMNNYAVIVIYKIYYLNRGLGGDGGISIRNRRLMLKVIDYETSKVISANRQNDNDRNGESFKNWGQEDQFFMSRIAELVEKKLLSLSDFRIASRNETLRFAANGGAANTDNFAASGILPVLSDDERNQFIMHCPVRAYVPILISSCLLTYLVIFPYRSSNCCTPHCTTRRASEPSRMVPSVHSAYALCETRPRAGVGASSWLGCKR